MRYLIRSLSLVLVFPFIHSAGMAQLPEDEPFAFHCRPQNQLAFIAKFHNNNRSVELIENGTDNRTELPLLEMDEGYAAYGDAAETNLFQLNLETLDEAYLTIDGKEIYSDCFVPSQ